MTALLHRLLHDHSRTRPIDAPSRVRLPPAQWPRQPALAAAGERLATRNEIDALRSLHPRRVPAVR